MEPGVHDMGGILDLCPCIAMMLRDRKHIVEYLSGTREHHKPVLNLIKKCLLQDSLNETGKQCLYHTCPACPSVHVELISVYCRKWAANLLCEIRG